MMKISSLRDRVTHPRRKSKRHKKALKNRRRVNISTTQLRDINLIQKQFLKSGNYTYYKLRLSEKILEH